MRIALGLEYDGASFHGWQSQPDAGTVQDAVESALARIAGEPIRTHCAGRTDAGVHALAQVAHFDTTVERPLTAWVRGVNSHLPPRIAVRWAHAVPQDFHARFSAMARRYAYVLWNSPVRPALHAGRVGWFHLPLQVPAMQAAARLLIGTRDFSAFRAAECQAKSPVKTLHRADVRRLGDFLVFEFRADAFLHHMVRNLVGALIHVGKGRHEPRWVESVLAGRDRSEAAPTFGPEGLYFAGADYDERWQLPPADRIIVPLALTLAPD